MKLSLNIALVISSLFLGKGLFAQVPVGAIELPEMNILYRGYPNKIIPAVTYNGDAHIVLLGTNCVITKSSADASFTVVPDRNKTTSITIVLDNGMNLDTIKTVEYRVSNLPDPIIYWGGSKSNSKADLHDSGLFAKYPPEVPLNASFSIIEWSIEDKGDTISGSGSNLSKADSLFRTYRTPTTVVIKTIVVGPDGIRREIFGQWKVDAWTEPKPMPKVMRCG